MLLFVSVVCAFRHASKIVVVDNVVVVVVIGSGY